VPGRRKWWPEGFTPHDPRGVAAHAWYEGVEDLDLASLPPEELCRLLGEAIATSGSCWTATMKPTDTKTKSSAQVLT
jgi:hypothetical protein